MPIEKLIEGFAAFREAYYVDQPGFYQQLVEKGQRPQIMVIACADSRVNPSIIAQAEPGELFVVRNVANLVPPYEPDSHYHGTSAAIEYAVRDLKVGHIVVLGHSHCGGIRGLCDAEETAREREFINDWVQIVARALAAGGDDEERYRRVEREAVKVSLGNLLTFPWVAERVANGELTLHGWWFELEAGRLLAHAGDDDWTSLTG